MSNRAGTYRLNLEGQAQYKSFLPNPMPPEPKITVDGEMIYLIVKASEKIGELNAATLYIPDINQFVSMYVRKEALLSSQIEGTQVSLDDIFSPQIEENTNTDVADVINYISAINYAVERLNTLPLCNRLIKETHKILLDENRGSFRTTQNWIGPAGCTIKNASYVPPNPSDMEQAMSDLEKYMNDEEETVVLVRAALLHYQFETIHPFLDGNGRIGRLLITLYLMKRNVLVKPALYISYSLKANRTEYYDRMSEVRRSGNFEQWVKFFLRMVIESATDAIENSEKLSALHSKNMELLEKNRASKNVKALFSYLESHPIIDIKTTAEKMNVAYNTVATATEKLINMKILYPVNHNGRNRTFSYNEYLEILRTGTEL